MNPLNQPVSSIMTREVYHTSVDETVGDAHKKFIKYKVRHLPVLMGDKLKGILSFTDIQRLTFATTFGDEEENEIDETLVETMPVDQVMRHNPVTIQQDEPVKKAVEILMNNTFHSLPVVDGEKLVGIVTSTDLLKFLIKELEDRL